MIANTAEIKTVVSHLVKDAEGTLSCRNSSKTDMPVKRRR